MYEWPETCNCGSFHRQDTPFQRRKCVFVGFLDYIFCRYVSMDHHEVLVLNSQEYKACKVRRVLRLSTELSPREQELLLEGHEHNQWDLYKPKNAEFIYCEGGDLKVNDGSHDECKVQFLCKKCAKRCKGCNKLLAAPLDAAAPL